MLEENMTIQNKRQIDRSTIVLGLVLSGLILFVRLWHITDLQAPYIWEDEMGYWSHAANLSGLSWVGTQSLWYSYGYSLILTPLFWITHDMGMLYRMAIFINALCGVISFWLGTAVLGNIDKNCGDKIRMLISFVGVNYSAYLFQSNIAWSETFLYTWFLFVLWFGIKFFRNPNNRNCICMTGVVFYLYMIHNRTLAVLIAFVMTVGYMFVRKKISWKKVGIIFLTIMLFYLINYFIKIQLTEMAWGGERGFSGNDAASMKTRFSLFTSWEGVKILIKSLCGKVWYVLTSTFMLAYLGMILIVKKGYRWIKEKVDGMSLFGIFLVLSILGTLAVTTIAMVPEYMDYIVPTRLDVHFYGRYTDMICGILIMLGLLFLLQENENEKKKRMVEMVLGCTGYIVCVVIVYRWIKNIKNFFLVRPCVPGLYLFRNFNFIKLSVIVLLLFLALMFFDIIRRKCIIKGRIVYFLPLILFLTGAENAYQIDILPNQMMYDFQNQLVKIMNDNLQYPVYIAKYYSDMQHSYMQRLRTEVVEGKICSQLPDENDYFMIIPDGNLSDINLNKSECCYIKDPYVNNGIYTCIIVGEKLKEDLILQGYECRNIEEIQNLYGMVSVNDGKVRVKNGTKENGCIISSGDKGIVTYGPYISIPEGKYRLRIPFEVISSRKKSLGKCRIGVNQKEPVLNPTPLKKFIVEDEKNGTIYLSIPFEISEYTENLEFIITASEGSVFRIGSYDICYEEGD